MHEIITPWQREFQNQVGKNHSRYFDQNGWLYFTKESFDLLYPSYGDAYPTYMGAIGMTYEQAGHGMAGLGIHTKQSKGKMVKVLFEPNAKLSDSLTYDITAWSLPYAYGFKAIASKTKVSSRK